MSDLSNCYTEDVGCAASQHAMQSVWTGRDFNLYRADPTASLSRDRGAAGTARRSTRVLCDFS
jgi:hypothetical protein